MSRDFDFPNRTSLLFGRAPDVQALVERAKESGLTAVVAPPRMGKTWLLGEVARKLTEEHGYLVGYHECKGEPDDILLRTTVDLYARWLADASLRKQAAMLWKQHKEKGEFIGSAAKAFGEILKSLGEAVPVPYLKAGEIAGKAFGALARENAKFKTGGITLQPLAYDQARDLVKIVADVGQDPVALILDAWEQSPSLELELKTLQAFLSHLKEWPRCHMLLGIRRPDPTRHDVDDTAFETAKELRQLSAAVRVYQLEPMDLQVEGERGRLIGYVRDVVPATGSVREDDRLLRQIGGFPGVVERWHDERERMEGESDLQRVADEARQNQYPEFRIRIPSLPLDELLLAMRVALLPRLDARTWSVFHDVLLDGLSESLIHELNSREVLRGEDYPTYGHETRHSAALKFLLSERRCRSRLKVEAEGLLFRLAGQVQTIDETTRDFSGALVAMRRIAQELELPESARALPEAACLLFRETARSHGLRDDAGALAAISKEPRVAYLVTVALHNRCVAKGKAGDPQGAIADWTHVLQMKGLTDEITKLTAEALLEVNSSGPADIEGKPAAE
ncbi:MAG TPA: hypothetical protein VM223_03455 [Planctomycetota bacterium]|nr:hypothetical protein [Planctomycetota bacterium]